MPAELNEWEERWSQPVTLAGTEPAAFLREVLRFLPPGRALDLATGGGRNAVFLAEQGWRVTGIDWSATAIDKAAALARSRNVSVEILPAWEKRAQYHDELDLVCADLENMSLPLAHYDAILCFNFLLRPMARKIQESLRPGGVLVFETFTVEQLNFGDGPRNPEYLLRRGELREMFAELELLFYREVCSGQGTASLLARKA